MDIFDNTQAIKDAAGWLATLSIFTFILSLLIIPWIVGKLPTDFFVKYYEQATESTELTAGFLAIIILRNIIGILLLLAGVMMLFLPGQGILTIIIGLIFVSFPGKRKLLFRIIRRPTVQRSLNWLRGKRLKAPFNWPDCRISPEHYGDSEK